MRIPKYLMTLSLLFPASLSFAQHPPPMGTEELKQVISTTIKKNGQSIATYEKSYKILTEQARMEHTLARMTYDGSTQKFRLLIAEVVNQGRVQKVDFKEMTTAKMTDPKYGVQDLREVVVPLTRLQVGSTVNLSYQIIGEPVVSGVFDEVLGISNVVLAKDERYIFESLNPLSKVTVDFDDAYEMIESRKGSLYRIEVRPTAKAYAEVGKKQLVGSLFLTTGKSWPDLNKAVAPYYEKQLKQPLPPELLYIANEAKKKSTTKMQLEFIATEVSKIVAYSGQWNNKAGKYYPRSSIEVVKSGRGDCKDYSTTMTAILRKLNYQAYPALTTRMRSPEMLEQIPKIMQLPMAGIFNHAIVWMKDSAGVEWWVDPTNPMVIADVILDDILGSLGLILDGKSSVTLLPRENKIEAVMAVQQKISIDKANEISTVGSVELNPVSYNQMGMIERQLGPEFSKKFVMTVLKPGSKQEGTVVKRIGENNVFYDFNLKAKDWVETSGSNFQSVDVTSPLKLILLGMGRGPSYAIGSKGVIRMTSTLSKVPIMNETQQECLIRSPWLDYDRKLEVSVESVVIHDELHVKKSFISKDEAKTKRFLKFAGEMSSCVQADNVIMNYDKSLMNASDIEQLRLLGSKWNQLTDDEALKEAFFQNHRHSALKRIKYYTHQLKSRPKDFRLYYGRARAYRALGSSYGEIDDDDYVMEASKDISEGLKLAPNGYDPDLIGERIVVSTYLKKGNDATRDINLLIKNSPTSFATFLAGARIHEFNKKWTDALAWLQRGEPLAKTPIEKLSFHWFMHYYLSSQKKYSESFPHLEYLISQGDFPAGFYHEWARDFNKLKDWDKVIVLELKALKSIDDQPTRKYLASVYANRANDKLTEFKKAQRAPASWADTLSDLKESLKYNPEDPEVHLWLSVVYEELYIKSNNPADLEPGKEHINFASKTITTPYAQRVLADYKRVLKY